MFVFLSASRQKKRQIQRRETLFSSGVSPDDEDCRVPIQLRSPGCHRAKFSRLRVWSLGLRVQGTGLRVQDLGLRVQGSGLKVQGSGFRVQGLWFMHYGL